MSLDYFSQIIGKFYNIYYAHFPYYNYIINWFLDEKFEETK